VDVLDDVIAAGLEVVDEERLERGPDVRVDVAAVVDHDVERAVPPGQVVQEGLVGLVTAMYVDPRLVDPFLQNRRDTRPPLPRAHGWRPLRLQPADYQPRARQADSCRRSTPMTVSSP
jgi:hypothetical protein